MASAVVSDEKLYRLSSSDGDLWRLPAQSDHNGTVLGEAHTQELERLVRQQKQQRSQDSDPNGSSTPEVASMDNYLQAPGTRLAVGKNFRYYCDFPFCLNHRGFSRGIDLRRHHHIIHGPKQRFRCGCCSNSLSSSEAYTASRKDHMQQHMRKFHRTAESAGLTQCSDAASHAEEILFFSSERCLDHHLKQQHSRGLTLASIEPSKSVLLHKSKAKIISRQRPTQRRSGANKVPLQLAVPINRGP